MSNPPGTKLDSGKNRAGLFLSSFALAMEEISRVNTFGAAKYSPEGWSKVPDAIDRYEDAKCRHMLARYAGESCDPESRLPHLAHEAWNAIALLEMHLRLERHGKIDIDRIKEPPEGSPV